MMLNQRRLFFKGVPLVLWDFLHRALNRDYHLPILRDFSHAVPKGMQFHGGGNQGSEVVALLSVDADYLLDVCYH